MLDRIDHKLETDFNVPSDVLVVATTETQSAELAVEKTEVNSEVSTDPASSSDCADSAKKTLKPCLNK